MISWQDLGCLRTAKLLVDRAELIPGWMTSQARCLVAEEKAEACCAMRMRAAQEEARGDLHSDDQLRWPIHREQLDTHQEEDNVVGYRRRRPGSAVAKGRRVATSGLDHSRVVAAERKDGGGTGAARAMGVSRGRCFLRAQEHMLALA